MRPSLAAIPIQPIFSYCIEQMLRRGVAAERLLAGSGLDTTSYQQPHTLVSGAQELAVYRNIEGLAGTSAIGLELGGTINTNSTGILGALLANAETVGQAGFLLRRYHALAGRWLMPELIGEVESGKMVVRYRPVQPLGDRYRFIVDRDIRGTQALLVDIFGAAAAAFLDRIAFGYPRPAAGERYAATFGCPVSFDHDATYVTFNKVVAELVNTRRSSLAYNSCRQLCRDALHRYNPPSWEQKVLNLLSSADAYPQASDTAAQLNCSERSLRRHLRDEGLRYSELVDRVRFDRAKYLLTHSRDAIKSIGFQLGYAEPSNFVHAFRRWSGLTATQFRQRARARREGGAHSAAP